jgi:UDP-N-acetylmuramoyl-L-alanyl-D-glutamate--2,6-diaminopimelate ligase
MTVAELLHEVAPAAAAETAVARAIECSGIAYDSRRVSPGEIFVALPGRQADGVAFAGAASAAGAAAIVAERPAEADVPVPWITVPDARTALAALSGAFFGHPSRDLQVVGVTGTNGKTTVSYLVRAILDEAGQSCGLIGTVSYGVAGQTVAATRTTPEAPDLQRLLREMVAAGCRACAMEVSSHALALGRVAGTRFAGAVFTNLTRDHLDFHAGMEDYFAAKRRLFEMLPPDAPAVVNSDDPHGDAMAAAVGRPITYAINRSADVRPGPVSYSLAGLEFDVRMPEGSIEVRSKLVGRPNVYNILAAVAVSVGLGVPLAVVEAGVRRLAGVPGRFQVVSGAADDVTVVVDYAHTDDALRNLLETARPLARSRIVTVFGAGGDRDRTKRPLMGMVAARLSDVVVLTSDNPRGEDPERIIEEVRRGAEPETRRGGAALVSMPDRREAIFHAVRLATPGDMVLVAGRGHEQQQEIAGRIVALDDARVVGEALEARRLSLRAG